MTIAVVIAALGGAPLLAAWLDLRSWYQRRKNQLVEEEFRSVQDKRWEKGINSSAKRGNSAGKKISQSLNSLSACSRSFCFCAALREADAGDFASDKDVAALSREWKVNAG